MTDRELLEAAARAAGYSVRWVDAPTSFNYEGFRIKTGKKVPAGFDEELRWNPLTDDGDALRLAVKLRLVVHQVLPSGATASGDEGYVSYHDHNGDPYAATRRSIVRAAAAMGSQK